MKTIDIDIIESIRKGSNGQVLTYLYGSPLQKIRKYILNNKGSVEDANDIFQDAVVILFDQVKNDKFKEQHDVDGFLYSVARNLWIDRMRRDKRLVNKDFSTSDDHSDHQDHLQNLIVKEKSEALRKAFERLDDKCRKILLYVIYEKLSMKEVSDKLGYSNENVAKSNHYRCKQYLAKMVREDKELLNLLQN